MGLLLGLRELKKIGVSNCFVDGDSAILKSWGMGRGDGSWCMAPIIYEIQELVSLMQCFLAYIERRQNELADKLAIWGVRNYCTYCDSCLPMDVV